MSKKTRKNSRNLSMAKSRASNLAQIHRVLSMEPYIRVSDRRTQYLTRKAKYQSVMRRQAKLLSQSPRRQARVQQNLFLKSMLPKEVYNEVHNCKREFSKVLAWRASRGPGSKRRSQKELRNSKRNFIKRDC